MFGYELNDFHHKIPRNPLHLPLFFTYAHTLQELLLQQVHLGIEVLLKQNLVEKEGYATPAHKELIPLLFFNIFFKKDFIKYSC